jgi:hypothetical protein
MRGIDDGDLFWGTGSGGFAVELGILPTFDVHHERMVRREHLKGVPAGMLLDLFQCGANVRHHPDLRESLFQMNQDGDGAGL